jgi:CRP-like cAMP-binding protein
MKTTVAALPTPRPSFGERVAGPVRLDGVAREHRARREILREGEPIARPLLLLSGWAARVRHFPDGRRQVAHLLVPGDFVALAGHRDAVAPATVVAMTQVAVAPTPRHDEADADLLELYARSAALEQALLLRQVARVGRLDAYDRLADLFLELRDRLDPPGMAGRDSFHVPLTQEVLADALGLTSVHLNRTLQLMRREGAIDMTGSLVRLLAADRLAAQVDHEPVRIHA